MIYQILWIIFAHWIADFVCQTHWQASNKSKNIEALTLHVTTYSMVMFFMCFPFIIKTQDEAMIFLGITFICHLCTDFITSKINAKLFGNWHWFFVSVGFDQVLHYAQLLLTWNFLVNG